MDEILNLSINESAQAEFDCSCGQHHKVDIHDISVREGALEDLAGILEPFKDKKVVIVEDQNTKVVAGDQVEALLKDFDTTTLLFDSGDHHLIPDEHVVGGILQEVSPEVGVIVAVGSGSLNDSAKFVSSRTGVPYVIVGTAPSMDGYLSDGAPLIHNGKKISYDSTFAYGVVGDTSIMKEAPERMIQAGFGDIIAKMTGLADFDLSVNVNDEYRCDTSVELIDRALQKCFDSSDRLKERDPEAIQYLIEALMLTGVSMALVHSSRPASGPEHMLSHYWEMDAIARGESPEFHGIMVGVGANVVAEAFRLLEDILPESTKERKPEPEEVVELLRKTGNPVSPKEIGISRELFHRSIMEANKVRPRYSIFQYAIDNGRIDELADTLTAMFYDEDEE